MKSLLCSGQRSALRNKYASLRQKILGWPHVLRDSIQNIRKARSSWFESTACGFNQRLLQLNSHLRPPQQSRAHPRPLQLISCYNRPTEEFPIVSLITRKRNFKNLFRQPKLANKCTYTCMEPSSNKYHQCIARNVDINIRYHHINQTPPATTHRIFNHRNWPATCL